MTKKRANAKVRNPEDVEITITATMSVKLWEEVVEKLKGTPYWYCTLIRNLVGKVRATLYEEVEP